MSMTHTIPDDPGCSGPMAVSPLPAPAARRFAAVNAQVSTGKHGEEVDIREGRKLWLRPIMPTDVDAIRRCFTRLSAEEIRMRFLQHMRELPEPMAQRLCRIDPIRETALVLEDDTGETPEIRGVGRIHVDETTNRAEFAVLVEKAWTGRGLGALLMQRLVDECRQRRIDELWGYVMIENRPMLDLCRALGFRRRHLSGDPGVSLIALTLG